MEVLKFVIRYKLSIDYMYAHTYPMPQLEPFKKQYVRAIKCTTNTRRMLYRAKKVCYCFSAAVFITIMLH